MVFLISLLEVGSLITTFNQTRNYFSRATKLEGDSETDGVIDLLKKLKKQISKLNKGKIEYIERFFLAYPQVEIICTGSKSCVAP